MIDIEADLASVFYAPGDFAHEFVRQRPGVASKTVSGIPASEELESLSNRALATQRQLLLPASAAVMRDDTLTASAAIPQWGSAAGDTFRVLDIERVADGAEVLAHIGKAGAP